MKKLQATLSANNKEIKAARAKQIVSILDMGQKNLIQTISFEIMSLENQITDHKDLAPKTTVALSFEKIDDAKVWIDTLHSLKVKLKLKQEHLMIAIETDEELFEEVKEGK